MKLLKRQKSNSVPEQIDPLYSLEQDNSSSEGETLSHSPGIASLSSFSTVSHNNDMQQLSDRETMEERLIKMEKLTAALLKSNQELQQQITQSKEENNKVISENKDLRQLLKTQQEENQQREQLNESRIAALTSNFNARYETLSREAATDRAQLTSLTSMKQTLQQERNDKTAVINNNTLVTDLIAIAERTVDPIVLSGIANHIHKNAASDLAVVRNSATLTTDLASIAARATNPAILTAIVGHLHHNAASDLEVFKNRNTARSELELVITRTRIPHTDLANVMNDPNASAVIIDKIGGQLVNDLNAGRESAAILNHYRASIGKFSENKQADLVPHVYKLRGEEARGVAVNMSYNARTAIGRLIYNKVPR
ncbi:MAG: hypothetical protein ABSA84_08275 [Gammaproteobacteria bacterium]